ncbi:S-layer homology domain-containing protein [Bacillus cereus group sp. TH253LC]|uniref:S-layer homology domain-containing protein n=1 Tax=Bacillus cereus group sp. TH253LC TaxID=3018043 RepID=UPI0022E32B7E|nr:S-layer homology domain-containing protein [Bacillus cereus group sp. TH253LC]MDA1547403.1 S-layer homology domain-containing protein [Bacillus cereus group sp. TH253LC]
MNKNYKKLAGVAATVVMAVTMVTGGVQAQTVDIVQVSEVANAQGIKLYNVPITFDKTEYTMKKGTTGVVNNLLDLLGVKAQVQTPEGLRSLEYYVDYEFSSVDVDKVGDYRVTFVLDRKDDDGKARFVGKGEAVIHVVDNRVPAFTFKNGEMVAHVGDTFNPSNYVIATDVEDGDITSRVKVFDSKTGKLLGDLNQEGTYKVQFTVKDSDGNLTVEERTLKVLPKKEDGKQSVFKDVPKNHWSEDAINDLAKKGLVNGYGDGRFGFGDNVTRGQVASLISRYLHLGDVQGSSMFTDTKGDMFEKDIEKVGRMGIMVGDGTGEFRPKDTLTRYEMAAVMKKAFNLETQSNENYVDVPKDHWAYDYTRILYGNKISIGVGNGKFAGDAVVKREQYVQFLYNQMIRKA